MFVRRFPGTGHGEVVISFLEDDYLSDKVFVYIPHYFSDAISLKIEYGPDFSQSKSFPLDGSINTDIMDSKITDDPYGGRFIELNTVERYDFRYALAFLSDIR